MRINMKDLKVIYEDNHLIVVIKPAGVPSQADKTGDTDMLTLVKAYIKEKYNKPGEVYLGLVHRLDRMTEGIMVFARTSKGASRLSEAIRNGDFKKEYIAAVQGKLEGNGHLQNYLFKDERTNTSFVVEESKKTAKIASLDYNVLGYTNFKGKDYTYVKIKLHTGRHHQIRVQMSHIGHPLYGDVKYGGVKGELALFACNLKFIHPTKDDIMEFNAMPSLTGIWEDIDGTNRN